MWSHFQADGIWSMATLFLITPKGTGTGCPITTGWISVWHYNTRKLRNLRATGPFLFITYMAGQMPTLSISSKIPMTLPGCRLSGCLCSGLFLLYLIISSFRTSRNGKKNKHLIKISATYCFLSYAFPALWGLPESNKCWPEWSRSEDCNWRIDKRQAWTIHRNINTFRKLF